MKDPELTFVIPTYRLRDVAETVDAYDEHFWRNGHDVRIVVFDDGTVANRDKYYALLEANATLQPGLLRRASGEGGFSRTSRRAFETKARRFGQNLVSPELRR